MRKTSSVASLRSVGDVRSELDLGLSMVAGLVRAGEIGSAIRLVDELRSSAADLCPAPSPGRRRRTIAAAGAAAALAVGGLAAAAVGPSPRSESGAPRPAVPSKPALVGGRNAPADVPVTIPDVSVPSLTRDAPPAVAPAPPAPEAPPAPNDSVTPSPGIVPLPELPTPDPGIDRPQPEIPEG